MSKGGEGGEGGREGGRGKGRREREGKDSVEGDRFGVVIMTGVWGWFGLHTYRNSGN